MWPYIKPYVTFFVVAGVVIFLLVAAPLDTASVLAMLCPVAFFIFAPWAIFNMVKNKYFRR
jgi:hypothetical protein